MTDKKSTVLVIDNEKAMQRVFAHALESRGIRPVICSQAREGIRAAASVKPDLVLLDLGLPDMEGTDVIKEIGGGAQTPVIACSGNSDDAEMIAALEAGASDYVAKPFNPDVLLARVQANLRKAAIEEHGETEITNGAIRMDLMRHEVLLHDQKVALTPKEYDLLRYFLSNRGKMLTHKQILKDVWGPAHTENLQYLRVYVKQLREKLGTSQTHIVTEPGIGYRMDAMTA